MRWVFVATILTGCPWISEQRLDARLDADGDGFVAAALGGSDCDDNDPSVHPGATEVCNGVDDDCDGAVDEDAVDAPTWWADADADGAGDPTAPITACETPDGAVANADDCDDTDPARHPGTSWWFDLDNDGYGHGLAAVQCEAPPNASLVDGDCDDANPDVHPSAPERCNGIDDNCDELVDDDDPALQGAPTGYRDADGDGFGDPTSAVTACAWPEGHISIAGDCDDEDPTLNAATRWYLDRDGDGHAGPAYLISCEPLPNAARVPTDCDDLNAAVNPDATEVCDPDQTDEDCDGLADDEAGAAPEGRTAWFVDADHDGWGTGEPVLACQVPPGGGWAARDGDCDDSQRSVNPETRWAPDDDGDGFGADGPYVIGCEQPLGHVIAGLIDCDDQEPTTYPGAPEACDDVDSDCDGDLNDGTEGFVTWYRDTDGDGWGDERVTTLSCEQPAGYALLAGDCALSDPTRHPGAEEICYDGVDQNCDDADDFDCDGDGYRSADHGGDDCDDTDPTVNPANPRSLLVPGDFATPQLAIDASCENESIVLSAGTYTGPLVIPHTLTLRGAGPEQTTLDAQGAGATVRADRAPVRLEALTLTGGVAASGGCLTLIQSDAALTDVRLTGCAATTQGGALYATASAVALTRVHIDHASAPVGGGMVLNATGGSLRDVSISQVSSTGAASAISLVATPLDIDGLLIDDATGPFSAWFGANVGGHWRHITVRGTTSSFGEAVGWYDAGGVAPLRVDDMQVIEPTTAFGASGVALVIDDPVWIEGARWTLLGGTVEPDTGVANALKMRVVAGYASVSNLAMVGVPGRVWLETDSPLGQLSLSHATLVAGGEGLRLDRIAGSALRIDHTIVAASPGAGLLSVGVDPALSHMSLFANAGGDWPAGNPWLGVDGNVEEDPRLLSWGPSLPPTEADVRLAPSSPLRDAGDPASLDPDGSVADYGAYGGPLADPLANADDDLDGMFDTWERRFGLDPTFDDADLDLDGDGLDNGLEFLLGTFPDRPDTDGDGVDDLAEWLAGTDPLDASDP